MSCIKTSIPSFCRTLKFIMVFNQNTEVACRRESWLEEPRWEMARPVPSESPAVLASLERSEDRDSFVAV